MKRYAAFEPPEYVAWQRDGALVREYEATLERDADRARVIAQLTREQLLDLYRGLVRNRLTDIALKRMVRQGVISKAWLGTGEEATTIGPTHALRRRAVEGSGDADGHHTPAMGDVVAPMIRNAGACHEMGMPVADMLKAYLGTSDTLTRGRDLHTGAPAKGIIPPTSFVASLVPVFTGLALSFQIKKERRVAMTWVGDGARWTAEFHEGMNLAAVQRAPLVIVLQDNEVALGTRASAHSKAPCEKMAAAYGVEGLVCDGNHVLDVHAKSSEAVGLCREGKGPVMLTAKTFRMGGHATHDEAEARALFPPEVFAHWGRRDPIGMYETWLRDARSVSPETLARIEDQVSDEVERAAEAALAARGTAMPAEHRVSEGVYALEMGER